MQACLYHARCRASRSFASRSAAAVRPLIVFLQDDRRHFSSTGGGRDPSDPKNRNKENFSRRFLDPARRGELLKHQSGIPKLAGRKGKANLAESEWSTPRGAKGGRGWQAKDFDSEDDPSSTDEPGFPEEGPLPPGSKKPRVTSVLDFTPDQDGRWGFMSQDDDYLALDKLWNEKKYYWNEEDYQEDWIPEDLDTSQIFSEDKDGTITFNYTKEDLKPQPHDWVVQEDDLPVQYPVAQTDDPEADDRHAGPPAESPPAEGETTQSEKKDIWAMERNSPQAHWKRVLEAGLDEKEKEVEVNPDKQFFEMENDIFEWLKRPDSEQPKVEDHTLAEFQKTVLPLRETYGGGGVEDFVQAMHEHPTDYARVYHYVQHPNSAREPKPLFSRSDKHIKQPPLEFVESFARFLYVTGLPPLSVNGELGDIENPLHRSLMEKTVAGLLRVDSTHVFVANASSAFVGFESPRELAIAIQEGPTEPTQVSIPTVRKYDPEAFATDANIGVDEKDLKDFVDAASSNECIIHLMNLPPRNTPQSLARKLIPAETKLREEFGEVLPDDILVTKYSSALVRFPSPELADSILGSPLFEEQLEQIGTYTVHYLRARRELRYLKMHHIDRQKEIRVYGPRLIVDGIHLPSKEFFISHASMLQIFNIDPACLDEAFLTKFFQKFSPRRRRVTSSIEFVRCELTNEPIQQTVYVGFEETEEAKTCISSVAGGRMQIGDRVAQLRLVKDRGMPRGQNATPEVRSTRSIEELEDDMFNWQKYVDPADVEYLDQNGVPRVILDEIFRNIRRNNVYFGTFDGNFRDEKIEPEKRELGQLWREQVRMFVETLKECVATPEDPGEIFLEDFREGEPVDLSIFDQWKEYKAKIDASRAEYYS